jgi:hypothetical protein
MSATVLFVLELADPAVMAGPAAGDVEAARLAADGLADAEHRAAARAARIEAGLVRRFGAARRLDPDRGDGEALALAASGAVSSQTAVRRLARWRRWIVERAGPPLGDFELTVFDSAAVLRLVGEDVSAGGRQALAAAIDALVAETAALTEMTPWDTALGEPLADGAAGATLVARSSAGLDLLDRRSRREASPRRLGPWAFAAMTLVCAAAAVASVVIGVQVRARAASIAEGPARAFVTRAMGPVEVGAFGLPRYLLEGAVEGGPDMVLEAGRAEHLRAAPGARFTVLPTTDPAQPWMLRSKAERLRPMAGPLGLATPAAGVAGALAVWWFAAARPLWRSRTAPGGPDWAGVARMAVRVLGLVAVVAAGAAARIYG